MSHVDLEQGNLHLHLHHHHQNHRRSVTGSDDGSQCFSDADEGSCYSQFYSTTGGSYDECSFGFVCDSGTDVEDGVVSDSRRASSVSDRSVRVGGSEVEIKVHLSKVERDCRICHLGLESNSHESGAPIELGCSCKDDLAAVHKNCAEAWFKIKGNKTCEICQSLARNIAGATEIELAEQAANESNSASAASAVTTMPGSESRGFWHGHRFLNFLLACMVFAFVVSWLFHFNVPSS